MSMNEKEARGVYKLRRLLEKEVKRRPLIFRKKHEVHKKLMGMPKKKRDEILLKIVRSEKKVDVASFIGKYGKA